MAIDIVCDCGGFTCLPKLLSSDPRASGNEIFSRKSLGEVSHWNYVQTFLIDFLGKTKSISEKDKGMQIVFLKRNEKNNKASSSNSTPV